MDTEAPQTDSEVAMKDIVLHFQMLLPAVVMAKASLMHLGTIPTVATSEKDISKVTSGELPKDLEVCPGPTLKQCVPEGSKYRPVAPR